VQSCCRFMSCGSPTAGTGGLVYAPPDRHEILELQEARARGPLAREARSNLLRGIEVRTVLGAGSPYREIVRLSQRVPVDLVAISLRRATGLIDGIVGRGGRAGGQGGAPPRGGREVATPAQGDRVGASGAGTPAGGARAGRAMKLVVKRILPKRRVPHRPTKVAALKVRYDRKRAKRRMQQEIDMEVDPHGHATGA